MKKVSEGDLTKELENVYGLKEYKSTLINYINYLNMNTEEKFANYNLIIECQNTNYYYEISERIIDFIAKQLTKNKIIKEDYYYLKSSDFIKVRDMKNFPQINEDLIVIDFIKEKTLAYMNKKELINFFKMYQEKVFIIIDKTNYFDERIDGLCDFFDWYIKLENIKKDDKLHFLNKILSEKNIKINENCDYINEITENDFYEIKSKANEIILKSKIYKFTEVNDEVVKKYLKEDKNRRI